MVSYKRFLHPLHNLIKSQQAKVLQLHCITLFPEQLNHFLLKGLIKRAYENKRFLFNTVDLREFGKGGHKKVDHYPFSHKMGMLLRADVVFDAVTSIEDYKNMRIIYTCPKGKVLNQQLSKALFKSNKDIILISGYYEGIDERIFDVLPIERVSIGDYIVNSGDCASAVIAESLIRQCEGVLGNPDCIEDDTHFNELLESPQFTQPVRFLDQSVPEILRSGNHNAIKTYKLQEALKNTVFNRPDLMGKKHVNNEEKKCLTRIIKEMAVKKSDT
ncbi:tRNA (guanosine(37)-N1)-methyltransferase TrmD [Candidatus Marinamargulisbacteria bacterium SCGC AG-343-D04]|nr:tRNA (guanosine(37)-N1)-methyltransferase TrmD [Candidatus Marinamargulisbacteria bacterium SCGC AG-343-D04]